MRLAVLGLGALWLSGAATQVAVQDFRVERPRPFGYVIGDRQHHVIHLTLAAPHRLVDQALPGPGAVTRHLSLRRLEWTTHPAEGATRYRLDLVYQLIGVPGEATVLEIPAFELSYTDGRQTFARSVPAWRFRVATLTPPLDTAATSMPALRPAHAPGAMDSSRLRVIVLTASGLLLVLLTIIAIRLWRARSGHRPFAAAYRDLRRLRQAPDSPRRIRLALASLHAAFDQTAGRALFADDLGALFQAREDLLPLRESIEDLYAHSRRIHFTEGDADAAPGLAFDRMLHLCRRCRDLERFR